MYEGDFVVAFCRTGVRRARIACFLLTACMLPAAARGEAPQNAPVALAGIDIMSHAIVRALGTHAPASPSASRFWQPQCPPALPTSPLSQVERAKCQLAPAPGPGPEPPAPTPVPGPAPEPPKPQFAYHPPGVLLEKDAGRGRLADRFVYLPGIIFPLKLGDGLFPHMNSQIWGFGGGGWGGKGARGGSESDRRNYDPMQQQDNYCEVRGSVV